jgi:hypothetical protein
MSTGNSRTFGIILFVIIGASALVLGVMGMQKNIQNPLNNDLAAGNEFKQAAKTGTETAAEILKNQDTDGDTLSDYDEINVYLTSAFIKDSDSDGIDDAEEIKNETDPNCPQGKNCGVPVPVKIPTGDETAGETINIGTDGQVPFATLQNAAEIRELLKTQGLSEEALAAIDDKTLVDMYNESAKSVNNTKIE